MNEESRKLIKINKSNNGLKFGVGDIQQSLGEYILLMKLGKERLFAKTQHQQLDEAYKHTLPDYA